MNARKLKHNNLEIEVGENLTLEDFLDIAYNVKDGFVTIARKDKKWEEETHYIKSLKNYIELDTNVDIYTSVNTFYRDRRRVSDVRHILKFYSDLDVYQKGISKEKAIQMIDFAVEKELIPDPTFVIDSGRGLYCLWIINDVPGKKRKVLKLYNYIQEFLSENLEEIGADKNALDVTRVLRLVGSYNTKNNEQVRVIRYRKDNIYTMKYMQDFMNTVNNINWEEIKEKIKERRKKQRQQKKKNKSSRSVARLFNPYTLALARSQDLEKLCELRNYDIAGFRNQLLHIYAYQQMHIEKDLERARNIVEDLNCMLVDPLEEYEIKSICLSTARAYLEHEKDSKKGYNYKNETIIEKLKITSEEQEHLKTIISTEEKYRRNNERKRSERRGEDSLTAKQREIKERRQKVKELHKKGFSTREIASKLNIHYSTVSRDISTF